jgi:RNA polymerase sigma factor (sigma-70 family)
MIDGPEPGGRPDAATAPGLAEHFFRHEYGRLVALLARRVGVRHLALVEDAVQSALLAALTAWTAQGLPQDPAAWLYRVAHNALMGDLRRHAGRLRILDRVVDTAAERGHPAAAPYFAAEVADGMLRMLFICCDDAMPRESRIVLALKTLCGFSTAEIALRLFTSEANVYKRLARARDRLRDASVDTQTPPLDALRSRLSSVHAVLYLLFNEGYLSAHAEQSIRLELCDEAIRLTTLLAEHTAGAVPETFALLALMHLHAASCSSRSKIGPYGIANGCESGWHGWSGQPSGTCSHGFTPKLASPPSIVSRRRSSRRAGGRSATSTRCWSASTRHLSTP